jgi:hypothetical protein
MFYRAEEDNCLTDRSLEEEIKIKAQANRKLARYMSSTQDLVEEQIRKAREKGAFDHLEGEGKPLDLEENPYVPGELRMAFKILKDNDFAPYWIELGKDIDRSREHFTDDVERFKQYCKVFWREKRSRMARAAFERKKQHFYFEKGLELEKINQMILDYNLHCPTFRLGRDGIKPEEEMLKLRFEIENWIEDLLRS